MNPNITIACSVDERYAPGLAVTILSLLQSVQKTQEITLYILSFQLSKDTRGKLLQSWSHPSLTVHWITPVPSPLLHLNYTGGVSPAIYFRLLLPELLPQHKKVLYLDSDLLVIGNILELWQTDLQGYPLGAVPEIGAPIVSSPHALQNFQELGLHPQTPYCNTGVLLMDLEQWRMQSIGTSIIKYCAKHKKSLRYWDQDGINAVLASQWLLLDPKWNDTAEALIALGWQPKTIQQKEMLMEHQYTTPHIIHFITSHKPWFPHFRHPRKPLFDQYLKLTAWPALATTQSRTQDLVSL